MKILYVIGSMEVGGAEKHLLTVASHFAKNKRNDIYVFAFNTSGPLKQMFEEKKVNVIGISRKSMVHRLSYWIRFKNLVCSSWLLFRAIWRIRPHIIHFYLPQSYVIGGIISFFCPSNTRIMSRRSLNAYQKKFKIIKQLETLLHKKMDKIVANSKAVFEELNHDEKVPPSKLKLIYNGIDSSLYQKKILINSVRSELGVSDNTLVFIKIANLITYKGHIDLIEAFNLIKEKIPYKWQVIFVGRDDGIGDMLKLKIENYQLKENFIFLNSRTDIPSLLLSSNVGILCSHQEGFSNAVLEMMASGLPIIVSDVGGNSEAVINGHSGIVVPPEHPQRLSEAILEMINNPKRFVLGENAYKRVSHTFSLEACLKEYENLYEEFF